MKEYIKYITLIKLVILICSISIHSQIFYYDNGFNTSYTNDYLFESNKTMKKLSSYSKELKTRHKVILDGLRKSERFAKNLTLDYSCNLEKKPIWYGVYVDIEGVNDGDKFVIRHNLIKNTYTTIPDINRTINSNKVYHWHNGIAKLIRKGCKKEFRSDFWLTEIRRIDSYLNQVTYFLKPGVEGYTDRKHYLFTYAEKAGSIKTVANSKFEEQYVELKKTYSIFSKKVKGKNYSSFNEFVRKNTNTIDDIDKLITISNGYINNDYSKYTLKEFESYIRGFISVGSNINLLTKKNEIMKINEQLILIEDPTKRNIYYTVNNENEVTGMYNKFIETNSDGLNEYVESYKADLIRQYIDHVYEKSPDYYSRVIDQDKSYSRFDKDAFWTCMGTVPIRNVIELEIYCNATATTNYVSYITTDNRYLIPEKKWYKFSIKNDKIYVKNWGYLNDVLIYDAYTKSFKIKDETNSPLSFEKEFIETLVLKDYDQLANEYAKSFETYTTKIKEMYHINDEEILLLFNRISVNGNY